MKTKRNKRIKIGMGIGMITFFVYVLLVRVIYVLSHTLVI